MVHSTSPVAIPARPPVFSVALPNYIGSNIITSVSPQRSPHAAILDGIRLIVQDLREGSRAAEAAFGLSGAQLFVLQTLAGEPGMSVNELAFRTYTHQSSVSAVIKKLVRRRLVTAKPSAADARRLELTLTARGRTLARSAPDAAQIRLIAALNTLSAAERKRLAAALTRLAAAMGGRARQRPGMFFEK